MSINAMNWVWNHSKLKGARKLMLLAIADWCNDDGECYYGSKKLTKKVGLSSHNSTSNMLRAIEKTGELTVLVHEGRETKSGNTNYYYMTAYRKTIDLETPEPNRHLFKTYDGPPKKNKGVTGGLPQDVTDELPHGVTGGLPNTTDDTPLDTNTLSSQVPTRTDASKCAVCQCETDIDDWYSSNGIITCDECDKWLNAGMPGYPPRIQWNDSVHTHTLGDYLDGEQADGAPSDYVRRVHKRKGSLICTNPDCDSDIAHKGTYYHNGSDGYITGVLCPGCYLEREHIGNCGDHHKPPCPDYDGKVDGCRECPCRGGAAIDNDSSMQKSDSAPVLTDEQAAVLELMDSWVFGDKPISRGVRGKYQHMGYCDWQGWLTSKGRAALEAHRANVKLLLAEAQRDLYKTVLLKQSERCEAQQTEHIGALCEVDTPNPPTPPKGKGGKKKPPSEHTLMKNALVAAMGYTQDDITCWGDYNKTSKKLRDAKFPVEDIPTLHGFSCGLAKQGNYKFKSPMQLAKDLPEYRKLQRQMKMTKVDNEAFTYEEES